MNTRGRWCHGLAGKGHRPYDRRIRSWGVGRQHSTEEAAEQRGLSSREQEPRNAAKRAHPGT